MLRPPASRKEGPLTTVTHRFRHGVLTLILNRPAKKNAVNGEMLRALDEALAAWEGREEVRVLELTGAGGCFSAGADLGELAAGGPSGARRFHDLRERVFARIEALPYPTLAAVEGYALGTGLELALCTDFRLVTEDAVLGVPSSRLGVVESLLYLGRLVRAVGPAQARFLVLTGRTVTGAEARWLGLAEDVCPAGELARRAAEIAAAVADFPPWALRGTKQALARLDPVPRLDAAEAGEPFVKSWARHETLELAGAVLERKRRRAGGRTGGGP